MKRKGFTLIEIISAIVIVGIIAIITVPITVRVIKEAKKRSFYATAEGIVKATVASPLQNEEGYDSYYLENETITFKFSKSEGKKGESVELIDGKHVKLSFEGKSPIGGEVKLYKNGDVAVVNLTDGTYYVNKDTDTELVITDSSTTLTREELQKAVEELQKQNQEFNKKIDELVEKDKEIEESVKSIDVLSKTYPIGSIYISIDSTNPSTLFGGVWERFGEGRTLVGVHSTIESFNTVLKTGGNTSMPIQVKNLPAHTHTIPSLTGSTNSAGAHTHKFSYMGGTYDGFSNAYQVGRSLNWFVGDGTSTENKTTIASAGSHTHTITTNAGNTGSVGEGEKISVLQPYITVYMWKRVS